jgi:hypothetical protein
MDATTIARANPFALAPRLLDDVGVAISRVDETIGRIEQLIGAHGTGTMDDATLAVSKDARLGVRTVNLEAQARIQPHMDDRSLHASITSRLSNADATLEDVNWQVAKKPSPDGRFNGVDLNGALRDARAASSILSELAPAAGTPMDDAIRQLGDDVRSGAVQVVDSNQYAAVINTEANAVQLVPRAQLDIATR